MPSSINRVSLLGNLGRDPDVRQSQSGEQIVNMTIATSEVWNDKYNGERREKTEWHRVVCFKSNADVAAKYLRKGSKVHIEGKLQTRSWDDAQSGQKRYQTEILAQQIILLSGRGDTAQGAPQGAPQRQQYQPHQQSNYQPASPPQSNYQPTQAPAPAPASTPPQAPDIAPEDDVPF